ncbi:MAG: thiosulfate oxidation carrier protein SoxY [Shimia sp.]|uniref:thiosulfate oxidation carrier protein SoxY n=1 Tax=Shimia sp. TaxID=1954381 RepID=UPI001A0D4E48|nr:thiosulfate oxidation carrier protein SoxY [Shimia sp.]MBE1294338.1 thiosulfate oxidation carrier protein SoxY [Paracoccaceae bacterium]MBO6895896.1 thiosulfate oxidation carrier protein SoxY [Shimia sp.]
MQLTRRDLLIMGSVGMATAALGVTPALASLTDDEIAKITGGAEVGAGDLSVTAPEIAENGNTVPIEISAPGATMVAVFADGNPTPNVVTFKFGPLNPTHAASTRIRLAKTQNVVAIAQMEDGSFQKASANVKVTIGGCGG